MLDLMKIREELDQLDAQLVELLETRLRLCEDVAAFKIETGKAVLDRERENQKLAKAEELAHGEFNKTCSRELFEQIMAMSRRLQYGLLNKSGKGVSFPFEAVDDIPKEGCRVVYQGVEGAYSQAAMFQYFGEDVDCYHVERWSDAMEEIAKGKADYGVFPIENSTAGTVTDIYDLMADSDNVIVAEQIIPIRHALLAVPGTKLEDIRRVCSHPQGLMQSAGFIKKHNWEQIPVLNTAVAAKKVLEEGDKEQAAIASSYAAMIHGLEVLAEEINDKCVNSTRFIIVSGKKIYRKNADKISISFALPHEKGTLYNMLSNIIYNGLNMTRIESRPLGDRNWEYRFFVDFEGNLMDEAVQNALTAIAGEAVDLKILGSY